MNLFSEAQEIISSEASKPLDRQAHVERFAFLLSAGRNNDETVLATKDAEELASFFSKRFLNDNCKFFTTSSLLKFIYHQTIQCTHLPLFPTLIHFSCHLDATTEHIFEFIVYARQEWERLHCKQ